jgi:hypothetical protein
MAINFDWRYKTLKTVSAVNAKFITSAIELDAEEFSTLPKKYIDRNYEQYTVAINLWLLLAEDVSGSNAQLYLKHYISEQGLCATIRHACETSNYVLETVSNNGDFRLVPVNYAIILSAFRADGLDVADEENLKDILQVLRFLKRFSPNGMNQLEELKFNAFLDVNFDRENYDHKYKTRVQPLNRYTIDVSIPYTEDEILHRCRRTIIRHFEECSYFVDYRVLTGPDKGLIKYIETTGDTADALANWSHRKPISRRIIDDLKSIISDMLKGFYYDPIYDNYSNGASQDTCKCERCKRLSYYLRKSGDPFGYALTYAPKKMLHQEWIGVLDSGKRVRPVDHRGNELYASKIVSVPKDYKGPRIIAPEAQDRQEKMKGIAKAIEAALVKNGYGEAIPLHDQSQNQLMALFGAATGLIATVDSSHASDSNMKDLVYQIFPTEIVNLFIKVMPTHVRVRDKIYPMHMFGTMGSALTFIVEAIVFYAIARLATEYTVRGTKLKKKQIAFLLSCVKAYGDDITLPSIAFEACLDLLRICGFEPNAEKSYGHGPYRESCGEEYLRTTDGEVLNISSIYWPRRDMSYDISIDDESLDASYLALANRLYHLEKSKEKVCHCHNYLRLWLSENYHTSFVPEEIAYPGQLIGVTTTLRVKSLLDGRKRDVTLEEYGEHPEYRVLSTTATKRTLTKVKEVKGCIHNTFTREQMEAYWDYIAYQDFLQYGPSYDDPVMELAGCSSRRMTLEEASYQLVCHFDTRFM